jgi:Zn-dependent M32 family carboxypeptidase
MQADLGVAPPDDRDGCLQDVHWYSGTIGGGFQSYTIGNILSAQFFSAAKGASRHFKRDRKRTVRRAAWYPIEVAVLICGVP